MVDFETLNPPILISHKIWVTEKFCNFQNVDFAQSYFFGLIWYFISFLIGLAPVQLINHSKHHMISYGEKENANSKGKEKDSLSHSVEIMEIHPHTFLTNFRESNVFY